MAPKATVKYGRYEDETFKIEGTDIDVWGSSWMVQEGNPAAMEFAIRTGVASHPTHGEVYYGKVGSAGKLFYESELEINDD